MQSKEELVGVFSRNADAYRKRLDEAMRKGQAAGRDQILDHLKPRPGMRILDLACGPGTLTIPMALELGGDGEVVGVDLADGMLAAARQSIAGRSLPVRFLRMDAENLQFQPATFDAVGCGHGLHFLPNLGRALREVRRVLKPRGRFAASIPPPESAPSPAAEAYRAVFDHELGELPAQPALEATRRTVNDLDRFQAAAVQAGFRLVETELVEVETTWDGPAHYAEINSNWWSYASRLEDVEPDRRRRILDKAEKAVRDVTGEQPFSVTSAAHVLRAEA